MWNKKIVKELENQGFKKKWLSDGSGYWWQKKIGCDKKYLKKVYLCADDNVNLLYLDITGLDSTQYKEFDLCKLTVKNIKKYCNGSE